MVLCIKGKLWNSEVSLEKKNHIGKMSGTILTLLCIFAMTYTVSVAQEHECPPNEVYRPCGSACPATCQKPYTPGTACIAVCVPGCFCRTGYIRNERTKKCVRLYQCPRPFAD